MAMYIRMIVSAVLIFLLSQILLFSLYSFWQNQQEYGQNKVYPIPPSLKRVISHPILEGLGELVGYGGGYGFYAPRVGSHFITEFQAYTHVEKDSAIHVQQYPGLRTLEGRIRYRAYLDLFSSLVQQTETTNRSHELQVRTARAMARSMSERLARRLKVDLIVCHVGVWYPKPLYLRNEQWESHYVKLHQSSSR